MKRNKIVLLILILFMLPHVAFAAIDGGNVANPNETNEEYTLAASGHIVSDIEVTRTSPFPECGTLTNHKGLTADYNDKGQIEAIRICNTGVVASHSSNLRYSNRMTWLVSPEYQKALAVRQDNNPERYPANTKLYFMTTVERTDLLLAFGDKLDQLDYIDSGAFVRSGYRNADMSFSPTNEGDWGYLNYGPAYHLIEKIEPAASGEMQAWQEVIFTVDVNALALHYLA